MPFYSHYPYFHTVVIDVIEGSDISTFELIGNQYFHVPSQIKVLEFFLKTICRAICTFVFTCYQYALSCITTHSQLVTPCLQPFSQCCYFLPTFFILSSKESDEEWMPQKVNELISNLNVVDPDFISQSTLHLTTMSHCATWLSEQGKGMLREHHPSSGNRRTMFLSVLGLLAILGLEPTWKCLTHSLRTSSEFSLVISRTTSPEKPMGEFHNFHFCVLYFCNHGEEMSVTLSSQSVLLTYFLTPPGICPGHLT